MTHTTLLDLLVKSADEIRADLGDEALCASHIATAVVCFCDKEYTGVCPSDQTYFPVRFEEERLRLIYSKEIKLKGYFKNILSRKEIRDGEEPFDFHFCEKIATARNAHVLSADVLFLCALKQLGDKARKVICGAGSEEEILARLLDTDGIIYDYVIESVEKVRLALEKKAEEAKHLRDWKPARKFAESATLSDLFFSRMEVTERDGRIHLKIPKFFGTSDLKLTVHSAGGVWYVHDNGCAIRHLSRHLGDQRKLETVLKKVCHSRLIQKGKVVGNFSTAYRFFYYLQKLVFIAHADLYYTKAEKPLYTKDKGEVYVPFDKAENTDASLLLHELKKGIWFSYDENEGLTVSLDTLFSLFSTRPAFALETLENGLIRVRDLRAGKTEGEIFEAFYWDHEDLAPYTDFIRKFADRFGAEFDGKSLYLEENAEKHFSALCRFFNLAVLLSEVGHDIALPKLPARR